MIDYSPSVPPRLAAASIAVLLAFGGPDPVSAQQPTQPGGQSSTPSPSSASSGARGSNAGPLEEIVVTARRRAESEQNVPISVSAFTGAEMQLRSMDTGRDLGAMVPNLVMGAGSLGQEQSDLRLRGIPGVGVYVDGVWQGDLGVLQANLIDMQRVEVLRGPQGTLFGRNTNGGAIQYVTERPNADYSIDASLNVGSYARRDAKVSLNVPLSKSLFTKWTAARYEHDGYLKSVSSYDASGTSYDDRHDTLLRGDLLWQPSDGLSVRLTALDAEQHGTEGRQVRFSFQPGAEWFTNSHLKALNWLMQQPGQQFPSAAFDPLHYEAGWPGGEVGLWETKARQPPDSLVNNSRDQTLTVNWDITNGLSLESITAHRTQFAHQLSLQDAADFVACCRDDRYYDDELTSQEFHITGNAANGKLSFLAGLYYSDATNKARLYRWWMTRWYLPDANGDGNPDLNTALLAEVRAYGASIGDPSLANYSPLGFWVANNHTWTSEDQKERALFGEVDWNLTDRLQLTLGARWSWRDVVTDTHRPGPNDAPALFLSPPILSPTEQGGIGPGNMWGGVVTPPAVPGVNEVHISAEYTPKFSVNYHWRDDAMVYATYSEGFSEGGVEYVSEINQLITLVPEVVSNFEVGIKSDLLNRSLRLNADLFLAKWDGLRVSRHPQDPNNPGQELPTPYTTSDGAARVKGAEAEIIWYPRDQFSVNFSGGYLKTWYTDIGDPDIPGQTLAYGARFAFAPTWSYSVGTQYDVNLANQGRVTLRLDYGWQGDYERDPSITRHRLKPEPGYGLLNLRTVYAPPDGKWSVALWGKNLSDVHYVDGGFVSAGLGFSLDTVGPPREFGVSLDVTF